MCKDHDNRWEAVRTHNPDWDGKFVYAVLSTGIYCKPSCPSRRPKLKQVVFFDLPELAEIAGFRPCRRCRPEQTSYDPRLERIREALRFIETQEGKPLSLAEVGAHVGISPHYLQREFKRALGVTPKQYVDALRLKHVRRLLREGTPIADAIYAAGFGSSSRLYERAESHLGMTPASYRNGGRGARIIYTIVVSPLGHLLVAATSRGVCFVCLGDRDDQLEAGLQKEFPEAELIHDDCNLQVAARTVLHQLNGRQPSADLPLDVRATAFQRMVWEHLRTIPMGETTTYTQIAHALGLPKGARAVGRACASNPVAITVPCHRVVRSDGNLGGYRWGIERKQALLEIEQKHPRKKKLT